MTAWEESKSQELARKYLKRLRAETHAEEVTRLEAEAEAMRLRRLNERADAPYESWMR